MLKYQRKKSKMKTSRHTPPSQIYVIAIVPQVNSNQQPRSALPQRNQYILMILMACLGLGWAWAGPGLAGLAGLAGPSSLAWRGLLGLSTGRGSNRPSLDASELDASESRLVRVSSRPSLDSSESRFARLDSSECRLVRVSTRPSLHSSESRLD